MKIINLWALLVVCLLVSCGERNPHPGSLNDSNQTFGSPNNPNGSEGAAESRPAPMGQPATSSEATPARTPKNWAKDKASSAMDRRYGSGLDEDSVENE